MNAGTCHLHITQQTIVKSVPTTCPKASMNGQREEKNPLPPPRCEPWTVQPEASCHANYTIQAPRLTA